MNRRGQWMNRLAIVPIPLLVFAIVALWIADLQVAWAPPSMIWLVHYSPVALGVAFIVIPAARSFLANHEPSVLMLGCGILMMDVGATAMPITFARSADAAFAIYNTSALLGALSHFAGVALTSRRKIRLRRSGVWLAATYAGGMAAMGLVIGAAFAGWMPVFFIDDQGGTLLRSVVVSTAVALFVLTAGLLWQTNRRVASPFLFWYALGLVLLAAGLAGSMLIAVRDSPLQWIARLTQVVGTVYMCVAVLAVARKSSATRIPLAAVEEAWRENALLAGVRRQTPLGWVLRYGLAVVAVAAAFGLWLAATTGFGPGLPPFITFYPAVMAVALLAGVGPGLLATALSGLTAAYCVLPPAGQFAIASPVDRLGLVVFISMGLFMIVVAELYRRKRDKAAAYDREAVVRESQARLLRFYDSRLLGVIYWNMDGKITDANDTFLEMVACAREDLAAGRIDWIHMTPPEYRHLDEASAQELKSAGVNKEPFEKEFVRKDGSRVPVLVAGAMLDEARFNGVAFVMDITKRKEAEARASRSQKTFVELVERSPFGTYVVDCRFRIAMMNAASQEGAFRNVRPVIGRDFAEAMRILWPEPVAAEIIGHFRHALESGESYYSPRFINPRHDVEIVESYEWELHRMTLPDGQYGVICYYYDSTKLREAEAALRRSEGRWNAAIESFGEGAIIATEAEQVIYWNPAARRLHGFTSQQEGIGPLEETPLTFELRTPDGEHLLALDEWPMRRIIRGETVRNLELRLRRPDQSWEKTVSYSGAMVETAGGERLVFLSVYDLTESAPSRGGAARVVVREGSAAEGDSPPREEQHAGHFQPGGLAGRPVEGRRHARGPSGRDPPRAFDGAGPRKAVPIGRYGAGRVCRIRRELAAIPLAGPRERRVRHPTGIGPGAGAAFGECGCAMRADPERTGHQRAEARLPRM